MERDSNLAGAGRSEGVGHPGGGGLWLGTAKVDITPRHPVPLAGFAVRSELGPFEGVAHPLYARMFLFRHAAAGGRDTSALIVTADLLWWGEERAPHLRRRIEERWGIPAEAVWLHGTHTHSGPQTSERFADLLGVCDKAYVEWLEEVIVENVASALSSLEPVTAAVGSAPCAVSVNRRKLVDGVAQYAADPAGPRDPELTVIRFDTAGGGRVKGVLVHYACHPVVSLENVVSSEFCGVAMEHVERSLGGGAVAGYLQGACGDLNPAGPDGELIPSGGDEDVRRIGAALAVDVLRVLGTSSAAPQSPLEPLEPAPLDFGSRAVQVPLQRVPTQEELAALKEEPWVTGDWARKLLAAPERLVPEIELRWSWLRLARGLVLLAANAELVVDYGLYAKKLAAGGVRDREIAAGEEASGSSGRGTLRVLPMGYTNGMIGYIPTAAQIAEGGYESFWSTPYFLLPSPLSPAAERIVKQSLHALLADVISQSNLDMRT